MVAYVNGQFIEEEKAVIGIGDLSIQRGYGIFDFFRTVNYVPLFIDDYLDRFFASASELRLISPHSRNELLNVITEMIRRNGIPSAGFKLILTGGYSHDGFELSSPNLIITQSAVQLPDNQKFQQGVSIMLHEYQRDLPYVKSLNYLMAIHLQEKLLLSGADEVLYHKNNQLLEFPRSNIFIVTKDHSVVTPAENVLQGITRKTVLKLASQKFKTEERAVSVEELKNAAEVFVTSTTKRILPVVRADGKIIGNGKPGEVTESLYHSFLMLEENYIKQH